MDWFKTKKTTEPATDSSRTLLSLVRTMEDDLAGRKAPASIAVASAERVVKFRPDAMAGAPFYAAPELSAPSGADTPVSEASPFLQESAVMAEAAPVADNVPTFDPPLPAPPASIASPAPPDTLPIVPVNHESTAVAFSTARLSAVPSLKESFKGIPRSFRHPLSIFQDRKIRLIVVIALFLLMVAVIAGMYLWWRGGVEEKALQEAQRIVEIESAAIPDESQRVEPPSQAKYLAEQPNILSFNVETVTSEEIKRTLLQAGQAIQRDQLTGAIEFLVRDQKLNPLALSRFAYLAGIALPGDLLGTLDEPFSLYIFIDNGRPRVVLLAYMKDQAAFTTELQKNEKNLASALEPLFLDVTTAPKSAVSFKGGAYLEQPVRFANVDVSLGLSIDYAVRGRQWIIGTSKESLHSVLDKIAQ